MPVEVLGFWRLSIAALLVGLWILLSKKKIYLRYDRQIIWVLLSGFFFFLHLWTYKFASKNTSIANTMILFASNPIWSSLGAIAFFKEKLTPRLIIAYLIALVGIYLLAFEQFELSSLTFRGDISAVVSAVFHACYMLTSKKARLHFTNVSYSFIQYGVCAFLFAFLGLFLQKSFVGYSDVSWLAVAGLVLLPTLIGHFGMTYLVKYMDLSLMSCGKLIEPIFASIIAYFLFSEVLKPQAWIAFSLTVISVLILFMPIPRRLRSKSTTLPPKSPIPFDTDT